MDTPFDSLYIGLNQGRIHKLGRVAKYRWHRYDRRGFNTCPKIQRADSGLETWTQVGDFYCRTFCNI